MRIWEEEEKKGKSVLGRKLGQGEVNETKRGSGMLCVGPTLIDGGKGRKERKILPPLLIRLDFVSLIFPAAKHREGKTFKLYPAAVERERQCQKRNKLGNRILHPLILSSSFELSRVAGALSP